jgi:hypothetical protein
MEHVKSIRKVKPADLSWVILLYQTDFMVLGNASGELAIMDRKDAELQRSGLFNPSPSPLSPLVYKLTRPPPPNLTVELAAVGPGRPDDPPSPEPLAMVVPKQPDAFVPPSRTIRVQLKPYAIGEQLCAYLGYGHEINIWVVSDPT